ncbi:MAG: hypothetical protein A2Z18_07660 [Armatimonadetes bacterium RBG_16_58_9]|nr:MAG: hypothetical protein A2Z18_07660 [Armatimonadetes bacterium RBG_16_58_9]
MLAREWPLDFGGWADSRVLTSDRFEPKVDEDGVLWLDSDLNVRGEATLLRYLACALAAYFDEAVELSKSSFMRLKVVVPEKVREVLAAFDAGLAARDEAETRYWRAVGLIDEIVETGFRLSDSLRERIASRMNEFPLSETANRPRLPWEESKKPRGRHFTAGERYHSV